MFENRNIIIATQHKKEEVIRPILEKEFGITCLTDDTLDTDQFGTFSGETERTKDATNTARLKCRLGMKNLQLDLAIASEGSFSRSNSLFGTTLNEEILVLIDAKANFEIVVRAVFHESNYSSQSFNSIDWILHFAKHAKFPTHGFSNQRVLSSSQDLTEAAKNLYQALIELDELKLDLIIAEKMPNIELGRSINDRLNRASQAVE